MRQAMNASFLSEMTAVQEAFDMWKVNHYDDELIPANGIVQVNDVEENGRLYGEIAYYRRWSETETIPDTSVTSDLNSVYDGDLMYIPRGVEDLYYLNNDEIGINNDKKYIIDATNSMIYSINGYEVNGIDVHSLAMFKAINDGVYTAPIFATAEVSGSGRNIIYAGSQYLMDKDGHYVDEKGNPVDNPIENPNGFQIISSSNGNNIFKLYNNGDLYGKGIKGKSLNTSTTEMNEISEQIYAELTFPGEILGLTYDFDYKTAINNNLQIITSSSKTIYIIDKNGELWAWGDNSSNQLGLTEEQIKEYSGREVIKLNINNKKVLKVFPTYYQTFVVTNEADPKMYVAGANTGRNAGVCGVGTTSAFYEFEEVTGIDDPENIIKIELTIGNAYAAIIQTSDGRMYCSGNRSQFLGSGVSSVSTFTRLFSEKESDGVELANKIVDFVTVRGIIFLKNDGTLWSSCYDSYNYNTEVATGLRQFPTAYATNIIKLYQLGEHSVMFEKNNGELWVWSAYGNGIGGGILSARDNSGKFFQINSKLPAASTASGIDKIIPIYNYGVFFYSNDKKIYYDGNALIDGDPTTLSGTSTQNIIELNSILKKVNGIEINNLYVNNYIPLIISSDNKCYAAGFSEVIFRDSILQKTWIKINPDTIKVKKFVAGSEIGTNAILDYDGNLWFVTENSQWAGSWTKTEDSVDNYIIHPSTLLANSDNEIVDIAITYGGALAVLLDNGDLLGCGYTSSGGSGVSVNSISDFSIIQKNVTKIFSPDGNGLWTVSNSKLYFSGWNFYGIAPGNFNYVSNKGVVGLQECSLPTGITGDMVIDVGRGVNVTSHLVTYDEENGYRAFLCGDTSTDGGYPGVNGLGESSWGTWTEINYDKYTNGERIVFIKNYNNDGGYLISENGNVYGWGLEKNLGIGKFTDNNTITIVDLKISNVSSLTLGTSWVVVVKNDGSVWGTGNNKYGILGRWIGINRSTLNSRYKTAIDWVECPDLEI